MGDRAIVVFRDGDDFSPCVYLHWNGMEVPKWLENAVPRMRNGEVGYSAARFCGVCHEKIDGNCALGILPPPKDMQEATSDDFSHGDAGVFIVDVNTWEVRNYNGYGEDFKICKPPE